MSKEVDIDRLSDRILDVCRGRARWDKGRVALTFRELADLLFARWPCDGRPTKKMVKAGARHLGGKVRVRDGQVVFREEGAGYGDRFVIEKREALRTP